MLLLIVNNTINNILLYVGTILILSIFNIT